VLLPLTAELDQCRHRWQLDDSACYNHNSTDSWHLKQGSGSLHRPFTGLQDNVHLHTDNATCRVCLGCCIYHVSVSDKPVKILMLRRLCTVNRLTRGYGIACFYLCAGTAAAAASTALLWCLFFLVNELASHNMLHCAARTVHCAWNSKHDHSRLDRCACCLDAHVCSSLVRSYTCCNSNMLLRDPLHPFLT
jgi:hypothetical protein